MGRGRRSRKLTQRNTHEPAQAVLWFTTVKIFSMFRSMITCKCGCGGKPANGKIFIYRHNLLNLKRTDAHNKKIGDAQKHAWKTKRKRKPIGSKNFDAHGYVRIKVVKGSGRWEKEHKIIMEKHLRRKLLPAEHVHHINGLKNDNRLENLVLLKTTSHHTQAHHSGMMLIYEMVKKGTVYFDREKNVYRAV